MLLAQFEKRNDFLSENFRFFESADEEHDLGDVLAVGRGHRQRPEELLEIVGQLRATRIAGVHGDEDADIFVQADGTPQKVDFRLRLAESVLDEQNLLRNGGENSLLQAVELVEARPRADFTDADENALERFEVVLLVAVEDEDEAAELLAELLDGFRLARSGGAAWAAAHFCVQRLRQAEIRAVRQLRLHEALGDSKIFVRVVEDSISHFALDKIVVGKIQSHHAEPNEVF